MLCLHLGIYRGKYLLTKPWYICRVFILAEITEVNLSSITITIKSNWRQILKSMHKMPAFIREAVALAVLAFFFFLFLSCKLRSQDFSGSCFCSTSRSQGESELDVRGHGRGLKPFWEIFVFC